MGRPTSSPGRRCGPWVPTSPLPRRRGHSGPARGRDGPLRRTQLSWPLRSDSSGLGMKLGPPGDDNPVTYAGRAQCPRRTITARAGPHRPDLALAGGECQRHS
ncbi:hypothetical protein I547_1850 [Mycobacterium kansasii 824]|nr:hypothetical protein I547_1850 [Mycobacterium kansasii 824]